MLGVRIFATPERARPESSTWSAKPVRAFHRDAQVDVARQEGERPKPAPSVGGAEFDFTKVRTFSVGRETAEARTNWGYVNGSERARVPPVQEHAPLTPQGKLTVCAPGDRFEREADRVAEQVMRGDGGLGAGEKLAHGSPPVRGMRADCKKEDEKVRRSGSAPLVTPASGADRLGDAGEPLSVSARAFFEPRFGSDFSGVRIHNDGAAHLFARDLGAEAATIGRDIYFAPGRLAPDTSAGCRLLAHELAHVVQRGTDPGQQVVHRQVLGGLPSAEAPGLSQGAVNIANVHLRRGEWQQAIDVVVDEAVRQGQIDRSKLEGGRVHYEPPVGRDPVEEGQTIGSGFRRNRATGERTAVKMPVVVGRRAFRWGLPWLYSSILHEYKHVIQMQTATDLPTIGSNVPSQKSNPVIDSQQDVETYAEEIARAHDTGLDKNPAAIRVLWHRLHTDNWMFLSRAERAPVKETYKAAYAKASAIPGVGPLPYHPLP